jgi:hypothetical protein
MLLSYTRNSHSQSSVPTPFIRKHFFFLENFNEPELKEFLISNMMYVLKKYSSIPLDILIAPFIKQIQLNDKNHLLTISDIQLLRVAAIHPKVSLFFIEYRKN